MALNKISHEALDWARNVIEYDGFIQACDIRTKKAAIFNRENRAFGDFVSPRKMNIASITEALLYLGYEKHTYEHTGRAVFYVKPGYMLTFMDCIGYKSQAIYLAKIQEDGSLGVGNSTGRYYRKA